MVLPPCKTLNLRFNSETTLLSQHHQNFQFLCKTTDTNQ
jgi:hypothetical protein